jgi:hypothetical protein
MMVLDDGGFACLQSLQLQLAGATEPESGDKTHSGPTNSGGNRTPIDRWPEHHDAVTIIF